MRNIIGLGETIYDVVFKKNQPVKAVPGGSTFNCMISLGRCGIPALFISEMGDDKIGTIFKDFMKKNNLTTDYIHFFYGGNSPIALAFLDDEQIPTYVFYYNFPEKRLDVDFPKVNQDDIIVFGSYFALDPILRDPINEFLTSARDKNAILYYDINFRKAHEYEKIKLRSSLLENFEVSTIIRCSDEDLSILFPGKSIEEIYRDEIDFYCKFFIVTEGSEGVSLITQKFKKHYDTPQIQALNTIGAGDSFNAGIVYSLLKHDIKKSDINDLTEAAWDNILSYAISFASEVCLSNDNYISQEFAQKYRLDS